MCELVFGDLGRECVVTFLYFVNVLTFVFLNGRVELVGYLVTSFKASIFSYFGRLEWVF